jgi:hypothetical protein
MLQKHTVCSKQLTASSTRTHGVCEPYQHLVPRPHLPIEQAPQLVQLQPKLSQLSGIGHTPSSTCSTSAGISTAAAAVAAVGGSQVCQESCWLGSPVHSLAGHQVTWWVTGQHRGK